MRFNLFLLFSIFIFCGFQCDDEQPVYPKGELTSITGLVKDSGGNLVTTGDIFLHPDENLPTVDDELFRVPILSDGTFEIAFFNEEPITGGLRIGRVPDENYTCSLFLLGLGTKVDLELTVSRQAPVGKLHVIHSPTLAPDSLLLAQSQSQNRCFDYSVIRDAPIAIADTLTEYTVLLEIDNPSGVYFGIEHNGEEFYEVFDYDYIGEEIVFEMRLD